MTSNQSNAEFFETLKRLIEAWCDRRSFRPLSQILGPYVSFNGMSDGWAELGAGLKGIRAVDADQLTPDERVVVENLIRMVDAVVQRR